MSDDNHEDRPRRNLLWLPPPLFGPGDRPDDPRRDALIQEAPGRVLRWTGSEWVDDLPGWLLLQYSRDRNQAREPTDVDRIEQARWKAWELGKRFRDAPPKSDAAKDAEQQLRDMAIHYAGRDGWNESWAIRLA
jgi:hypothetical protein